ncbi:hypothetical protein WJX72_009863 [[Myrmecia] bisecta]|uniref:Uncharacterized protein n=1 Tax=[Myrmecia] bisecta TaxID=41462 RepID=A0AAW1PDM2_9CHLO
MLHGSAALVADHFGRAEAGSELQQGAEDSRAERSAPPRFVPALNLGRASRREGEVEETGVDSPNGGWQDLRVDGGDLSPLERATHRDGASLDNQPASARAQHITLHRALGVQTRPLQGSEANSGDEWDAQPSATNDLIRPVNGQAFAAATAVPAEASKEQRLQASLHATAGSEEQGPQASLPATAGSHSKQSTKAGGPFPRPWQLPQSEPPLTTHTLRHEEAFAGRGMSIATVNKEDVHRRREMGRLMTENEDLKDEVQYLRRLLKITQPETLATQTQEPSKSEPPTTAKPAVRSLFPAADGDAGGVGRALSREQMLKLHNVQLERQLLKADGELRARQEVAAAANTVLAELQQRLQQALPRDADAGGDLERMVAADELLKLRQWAADTMTSLKQVRRAAHTVDAAPHEASMSPNAETQGTMGTVAWEIPFLSTAGGGNVFMPAGATPTVTGICRGEGVLLADPAKVQQLEAQLGALAPQLAALCESLQSTLLPALPSLCPPLAARLKVDTRRAQIPGMLTGPTPASNAAQQVQGALDTLQQRYDMALHRLRQARQGQIAALAQSAT